jgi:hypothetical protein
MKTLDFVITPKRNMAVICETNNCGEEASIWFIGEQNPDSERNAWWNKKELIVIDSVPHLLGMCMCHPFGIGKKDVEKYYPIDK